MHLYNHQKEIIDADPKRTGLFLGTGSGKTRTALLLARGYTLVICPKTQKEDGNWEREYAELAKTHSGRGGVLTTITFDMFKTRHQDMPRYDTVIVDEAHGMLGVTPNTRQRKRVVMPRSSQRFEALTQYLQRTQPDRLYLCTATILKSPMTVWGAYRVLRPESRDTSMKGFYEFREKYYARLPMPGREVFAPRSDSKTKDSLAQLVRSLGYTGRLEDYFDVPEQTFKTEYVELTAAQKARIKELKLEFPEPIVRVGKQHQVENGTLAGNEYEIPEFFSNAKTDRILEYAMEFKKIVVFAKYTAQIHELHGTLSKAGYKVLMLTGHTKDRGAVIKEANDAEACIFIAQSQISAGWEIPNFPVMIFASMTYSLVDRLQAEGRILRANHLKKNLYITLVVRGGVDEAVSKAIASKQDFHERQFVGV